MYFCSILPGLVFRWPFLEDDVQEIQLDWMVSKKITKKIKFPKPQSTIKGPSINYIVSGGHCVLKWILRGHFLGIKMPQ